ncbi:hypothetical protein I6N95_05145 [Vagococcus sp. BWB3-3]|uniref:Uncharacterized protein n=1 Tax=Vagococcus allomyrinae TaxID=2794353 RepID=A0A940P608_9ENTE|nr:hypothetical protein [Vagococcus allomyrinae]MBP1040396.1 hypothetical protein [Vagococcus allomyrinae]
MVSEKSVNVLDKLRCKRPRDEDKRFKHEYIGLVEKKYEKSALVIIAINHPDDDKEVLIADGRTIVPYSDMTRINETVLFFNRDYFLETADKRELEMFKKHVNVMEGMAVVFSDGNEEGSIENYRFAGVDCQMISIKREWCTLEKETGQLI